MKCSKNEVLQYVAEEDVKFIRLAFCDVFGRQKNISVLAEELPNAFQYGVAFDASAIAGFGDESRSDLILHPDPDTLTPLPWRPEHGRVVRMFCSITYPDGTPFECDTRSILKKAVADAAKEGYSFEFGAEQEFYLFEQDEKGQPTNRPYDRAGYMDIAPEDRGENIRREICLTLEQMGIRPESSHHEAVVRTVAARNGLYADFSPKPIPEMPGNGFHINMSVHSDADEVFEGMIAGVLSRVEDMTAFLNPTEDSYKRLGLRKAPGYISWSKENRSQLVRIPAVTGGSRRAELRSPDPAANPYLAFSILIYAALEGITQKTELPPAADINFFRANEEEIKGFRKLPGCLADARKIAGASAFIKAHLPEEVVRIYCP